MSQIRKQLTLFLKNSSEAIEKIRAEFNPEQYKLISAHITLCREDEIEPIAEIIERIKAIELKEPIRIELKPVKRFADGKGVLIPATDKNSEFSELRKTILGSTKLIKVQFPHITLMHPRNSTCNDILFAEIEKLELPNELFFDKITLIEQENGGKWNIVSEFNVLTKNMPQHFK